VLKYEWIKGGQMVSSMSMATTASSVEPMDVDTIQFVVDSPSTAVTKSKLMIPMSQLQQ
ncbi:hypothetical protein FBU31_008034, partial [Coemansia sp. 'formosensis']